MAFLPGILVYEEEELVSKLELLTTNVSAFTELTGQLHYALHVDIILPGFAESRNCAETVDYKTQFDLIQKRFSGEKLRLSIHIMGGESESLEAYNYITKHLAREHIFGEIYVPYFMYKELVQMEHHNWIVGSWYDKKLWNLDTQFESAEVLLMTVLSGSAGQEPDSVSKSLALALCDLYPDKYFLLDGGWKITDHITEDWVETVVNTDFWNNTTLNPL